MKKYYCVFNEGSKINQYICVVLISLPAFSCGVGIGWMSPVTPLFRYDDYSPSGKKLPDILISSMAAVPYITGLIFSYVVTYFGDKFGRKITLMSISASCAALWIIKISSTEVWAFLLARVLVGGSVACTYVTCQIYTKEIIEESTQFLLNTIVVFQALGVLFVYTVGNYLCYNAILWVCLPYPLLHIALFMMMPESPYFLVKKGNVEAAARVLAWLRCRKVEDSKIQYELDLIAKEQKRESDERDSNTLSHIRNDKILFRAFRIAIAINAAKDVCGNVLVVNFATDIFYMTYSEVLDPYEQSMLLAGVQLFGVIIASNISRSFGRKTILYTTSLVSGLSMCALGSWFVIQEEVEEIDWLPNTVLVVLVICDAVGLQPISNEIAKEILPLKYQKSLRTSIIHISTLLSAIQLVAYTSVVSTFGASILFFNFGIVGIITSMYIIIAVPETKGRSIEDIHHDIKTKREKDTERDISMSDIVTRL